MIGVAAGWACGGSAGRESGIPVLEMVLDGFEGVPEFTAEDSAAVQRLENGEGPIRLRMVMCDEVLVDEVVSSDEELSEVIQRPLVDAFGLTEGWPEEPLAELEAIDPDSIAAAWRSSWEAMTPAEREEFIADMERLMPMLDAVLDEDVEALDTMSNILAEMFPETRETLCDEWRRVRAEMKRRDAERGRN